MIETEPRKNNAEELTVEVSVTTGLFATCEVMHIPDETRANAILVVKWIDCNADGFFPANLNDFLLPLNGAFFLNGLSVFG
jgi:hypothetical protein